MQRDKPRLNSGGVLTLSQCLIILYNKLFKWKGAIFKVKIN